MNKADLKQVWGNYCDTDKLVDDMMALLTKYHHENTEHGVCSILNQYFTNKRQLINLFTKSSSYIGNMRICLDVELSRNSNSREITDFVCNFPHNVGAEEIFLKYVDEEGKTKDDYMKLGITRFKARALHYGNVSEMIAARHKNLEKFLNDGCTKVSYKEYENFGRYIEAFYLNPTSVLNNRTVDVLQDYKINATFTVGMKTSRAFNRLCALYGVDKLPKYNRLFAQYADMVSGLKRKVKFYISLNPLDYLTMSFGNSWSSCHTIDKNNEREMPSSYQGMHCGGTMSYMLDKTSIITYVHDHATENHEDGKLYRNMFHYDAGVLIQGRVYPQGNDGATDLYEEFRHIVQSEFSKLLELDEDRWTKRNRGCSANTATYGVHYADYLHFDGCNTSYPSEWPNVAQNVVAIGYKRICPKCGEEISNNDDSGYLVHEYCEMESESDTMNF